MPSIRETDGAGRALSAVITSTYPSLEQDQVRAILRPFLGEDVDLLSQALDAHILDPEVGKWPPKPADLAGRVAALRARGTRIWKAEPNDRDGREVEAPEWSGIKGKLRLSRSRCSLCADSGLAWYYHEPRPTGRRNRVRAWTSEEALAMTETAFRQLNLRCANNAVCRCAVGRARRQDMRQGWTTIERIEELAQERRQFEQMDFPQ